MIRGRANIAAADRASQIECGKQEVGLQPGVSDFDKLAVASPKPQQKTRVYEIDGIRGWAALSVMLAHLCFGVFGQVQDRFMPQAARLVLEPLLDGTLDVAIFFVLSGDALSVFYWNRQSRTDVARGAIKRYFRLEIPIFVACLIVFVLISLDATYHVPAAIILNDAAGFGSLLRTQWDIGNFLTYAFVGVFGHNAPQHALHPFLWTMPVELLGSMLLFVYLYIDRYVPRRAAALMSIFLVFLACAPLMACFAFGMLCGHVRSRGGFASLQRQPMTPVFGVACSIAAVLTETHCNHVYPGWNLPPVIAACIVVFSIYSSQPAIQLFRTPFSRWLGRISFPLYLMHFVVIITATGAAVMLADSHGALGPIVIWSIILGSAAFSVLAAMLFLPVEQLTSWLSERVCRAVAPGQRQGIRI